MWAVRILTGEQAGQVIPLKGGKNLIGRAPQCNVRLNSTGISKTHAEIQVYDNKIILIDLNSRNGTFLNGIRIHNSVLKIGDKIGLHNIIVDVLPASHIQASLPKVQTTTGISQISTHSNTNAGFNQYPALGFDQNQPVYNQDMGQNFSHEPMSNYEAPATPPPATNLPPNSAKALIHNAKAYFERVAMPGVYRLPQLTSFRNVLMGFIVLFILMVTLLSVIPMVQITRSSIEMESRLRTLTIARNLARTARQSIIESNDAIPSTRDASLEDGVVQALIINHIDGSTMAPAEKIGQFEKLPFIHKARQENKEVIESIDSDTIGASVPITYWDSAAGVHKTKAHAVVIYKVGTLSSDDGRTLNLFLQTLIIAIIIGALLFYFLYKLIERPFVVLNEEIDTALREGLDTTTINFQFPPLQNLLSNINSILSRLVHGTGGQSQDGNVGNQKELEAENLLQLIGYPAMALSAESIIIASNSAFESLLGIPTSKLQNNNIKAIPDQAFQLSVADLIERSTQQPSQLMTNNLDLANDNYILSCQAITNRANDVEYYIVTISPIEGGS